jgi:hypothetical protein
MSASSIRMGTSWFIKISRHTLRPFLRSWHRTVTMWSSRSNGLFTWYWLADLCAQEGIPFVLGHALYMKAIHGGKAKNDKIDAQKIALLLRGGMLPQAYVYPAAMRASLAPHWTPRG